ncbi:hypothetical protein C1J01_13520 [Nonomuraea aridisoli]|uniref:Uncharacterized protein n=1 Tax=Nonomuraea aridisoli TaxID=2070368 RepID=A0A2W2EZD4_9ACTN|nr:hypothetical protein [Nonomuraea aridisoli]PZG18940.1 hypothetical protein C1J01_13520 [Nonomuraea aridisoli]
MRRPEARRLVELVDVRLDGNGDGLLAGWFEAEVHAGGEPLRARMRFPPGSPQRPPTPDQLRRKVEDCVAGTTIDPGSIGWASAAQVLRRIDPH